MKTGELGITPIVFVLFISIVILASSSIVSSLPSSSSQLNTLDIYNQTHDTAPIIAAMESMAEITDVRFDQFGSTDVSVLNASENFSVRVTATDQGFGNPIITVFFENGVDSDANLSLGFNLTQYDDSTLTTLSKGNITLWYNLSYTSLLAAEGTGVDFESIALFSGQPNFSFRIDLPVDPSPSGGRIFAGIASCADTVENGTCNYGLNQWVPLKVCASCQDVSVNLISANCSSTYYSNGCPSSGWISSYNKNPVAVYGVRDPGDNTIPTLSQPYQPGSDLLLTQGVGTSIIPYSITANDPDYDLVTYSWFVNDTALEEHYSSYNFNTSEYEGFFNVTVMANDSYGGAANYTWNNITITPAGRDRTWINRELTPSLDPAIPGSITEIQSILFDPARDRCTDVDQTWYGLTAGGGYKYLVLYNGTHYTQFNQTNTGDIFGGAFSIEKDSDNNIWVGSHSATTYLAYYDGTQWVSVWDGSEQKGIVRDIELDSQGNMWVATEKTGLYKFIGGSTSNVVNYNASNSGLPEDDVYSIASDGSGNYWLAVQSTQGEDYVGPEGPEDGNISGGNFSGVGVIRFNGVDEWYIWNQGNSELTTNTIKAIEVDNDGIVYAGTKLGLFAFNGSNWSRIEDVPIQRITYLKYRYWEAEDLPQDENSLLWMSTRNTESNGIHKYNGSHVTTYTTDSGLYWDSPSDHGLEVTGDRVWAGFDTRFFSFSQLPTATITHPTGCEIETNRTLVINFTATGTNLSEVDHVHPRLTNTTDILYPYLPHADLGVKVNASFTSINQTYGYGSYTFDDVSDSWNYTIEIWLTHSNEGYFSNPHSYDIVTFILDATPPFNSVDNPQGIPADLIGPHIISPSEINPDSPPYNNYTSMSIDVRPWDELIGAQACWYTFSNASHDWTTNTTLSAQNITSHRSDLTNPHFSAATQPIRFTGSNNLNTLNDGGIYEFKLACNDSAGNENLSDATDTTTQFQPVSFRADNSPPYVVFDNLTTLHTGYVRADKIILDGTDATSATIRLSSAADAYSFVDSCWYTMAGGNSTGAKVSLGAGNTCNDPNCEATLQMADYSDAVYLLTRACNDSAMEVGNINLSSVTLYVDRLAPSVSIAVPQIYSVRGYNDNFTADINPTDNVVGVANCSGKIDNDGWTLLNGEGFTGVFDLTAVGEGNHTFYASCTDYAGHTNDTVNVTFFVDKTPPVINEAETYILPCPALYTTIGFFVNVTDNHKMSSVRAQVTSPTAKVNTISFRYWTADTYIGYYYLFESGTYTVDITAYDSAGNTDTFGDIQPQPGVCS
ncbi:MAG: hypothetical protein ABH950_10085 [Candidatus Altiarchaeota archaeon]